MTETDVTLAGMKAGLESAWADAFRRLWPLALHAAAHPSAALAFGDVEDAAAEALEQLAIHVPQVASFAELERLTLTIAYCRAISAARRNSSIKRPALVSAIRTGADGTVIESDMTAADPSPVAQLEVTELAELLAGLLQELDEKTRCLLHEKIVVGLTYEEISRRHQIPLGTVCTKVARGLKALRQVMNDSPELLKELEGFLR